MGTSGKAEKTVAIAHKLLRSASDETRYNLHVAALEWSLASPIVLRTIEDAKSKEQWQHRIEPFAHQVQNLLTFCRRAPVALFADDVGLGKTVSAGLVLAELIARGTVTRCLVVAPTLLLPQWQEELRDKFQINSKAVSGSDLKDAITSRTNVVITTYASARNYIDDIRKSPFDMVILDEAHKLRNLRGNTKPPALALTLHKALKDRLFKYVLLLTATPIQNSLWDIYSLIDLLCVAKGHNNAFGDEQQFSSTYLQPGTGRATSLRPGTQERFRQILSDHIVRTKRSDSRLRFPTRHVHTRVAKQGHLETKMLALIQTVIRNEQMNGLAQVSIAQAAMSSLEALATQLENMAKNGTIARHHYAAALALLGENLQSGKLQCLRQVIDELQNKRPDWRLIVFTMRKETQRAIEEYLRSAGISFGSIVGGSAATNQDTVERFRSEPPRIHVIVSTDAGAEGVNLQAGNVLINFDLPWNPMTVEQRIGRIQRLGTKHDSVHVLNFVVEHSVEQRVVARLIEKLQAVTACLGDIESILETASLDGDAANAGFEAQIRHMVLKSLQGGDVEQEKKLVEDSIAEAKRLLEEERDTVEKTLGAMDAMHHTGPSVPEISPFVPHMPPETFVHRALEADGARIRPLPNGVFVAEAAGRVAERFTFQEQQVRQDDDDAPIFTPNAPKLYKPGKPAFERLTQTWALSDAALVWDFATTAPSSAEVIEHASRWLASIEGASLVAATLSNSRNAFQGEVITRITSSVAHDKLEKLVSTRVVPPCGELPLYRDRAAATPRSGDLQLSTFIPDLEDRIREDVMADRDVLAFTGFYQQRLAEELQRINGGPSAAAITRQRLTPSVAAEPVAVNGVRLTYGSLSVRYTIDGLGDYLSELPFPARTLDPQVLGWCRCEVSNRLFPPECIATCAISGRRTLRHMLLRSTRSHRSALPEHTARCESSGKLLLSDELGFSDISAKRVDLTLLVKSALSTTRGLVDELITCEFTGVPLAPHEAVTSAVSGKQFRVDQHETSMISGSVAHRSEMVRSVDPVGLLLPSESQRSAVSGRAGATDRMVESTVTPGRVALPDEVVTCEFTNARLFTDEAITSCVSGKLCDRRLAGQSAASGQAAALSELVRCERTERLLLPSEAAHCDTSALLVDRLLLQRSELSGGLHLPEYLVQSAQSGKRCLKSEAVTCEETGCPLLPTEADICCVTGKTCDRRLLRKSAVSGRSALAAHTTRCAVSGMVVIVDEVVNCQVTGKPMQRKEAARCAASGLTVLPALLIRSDVSQKSALPDYVTKSDASQRSLLKSEAVVCEDTGATLAPDERERCAITGKLADRRLLAPSSVSSRMGLSRLLSRCAVSGKSAFPDELTTCALTGQRVLQQLTFHCMLTARTVLSQFGTRSAASGALFTTDEEANAHALKTTGFMTASVECTWLGAQICATEAGRCKLSGLTVASKLLNTNQELALLRTLLDATTVALPLANELLAKVRALDPSLSKLTETGHLLNETGTRAAFSGRSAAGLLGFGARYSGGVLSLAATTALLAGPVLTGTRKAGRWERVKP